MQFQYIFKKTKEIRGEKAAPAVLYRTAGAASFASMTGIPER